MTLPVVFTANGPSGYNLTKSVRLRGSATGYLSRTPASAGNQKTWTYSTWIKRGAVGAEATIISGGATTGRLCVFFNSSGQLVSDVGGTGTYDQSTAVYRDPSAWYHFVWQFDTTQATGANRSRMYINGVQVTLTNTRTFTQNADYQINNSVLQTLGTFSNSIGTYNFDGYQTETNFIDGQALTPSSFGSTNALTGVWQPAKYTGTYGTNGFYLPFTDVATTSGSNAGLGKDFSGNGNYWTTNNISVTAGTTYDSMSDVPTLTSATTANYCVLNPLNTGGGTYSNGNLQWVSPATDLKAALGTIALNTASTGKWYWEVTCVSKTGTNYQVMLTSSSTSYNTNPWLQYRSSDGVVTINGSSVGTFSTFTTNDVIGVTFDASNSQVALYKNNTLVTTQTISNTSNTYIYAALGSDSSGGTMTYAINFGQQPFSYTPPTGFVALNTFNLPTGTIVKGNTVMNALTWTGTGTSSGRSFTGLGFKPDLVWGKPRSLAYSHSLSDSVRGANKRLQSQSTSAEETNFTYGYTSSFDSDGFTTTAGSTDNENWNQTSETFVAWCWQAGQGTTSSNTNGSITSTVSVNASAGFSVVTYTGNNTLSTIGHGLGASPKFIIVKTRSGNDNWVCYHGSLGVQYYTLLNTTASSYNNLSDYWSATAPSSSVFGINAYGGVNTNGATYVAYCWAEIAGFSKFGSYTGNGSTDGPFVYTGFRPRWIMIKVSSGSTGNWLLVDTTRSPYNEAVLLINPDTSDAESTITPLIDILSNGFKIRRNSAGTNGSGYTYIYAAFAENPFKNALAR